MKNSELLLKLGVCEGDVEIMSDKEKEEIVQVELPDGSYRNIKEVFFLSDRTVIRLEDIPCI